MEPVPQKSGDLVVIIDQVKMLSVQPEPLSLYIFASGVSQKIENIDLSAVAHKTLKRTVILKLLKLEANDVIRFELHTADKILGVHEAPLGPQIAKKMIFPTQIKLENGGAIVYHISFNQKTESMEDIEPLESLEEDPSKEETPSFKALKMIKPSTIKLNQSRNGSELNSSLSDKRGQTNVNLTFGPKLPILANVLKESHEHSDAEEHTSNITSNSKTSLSGFKKRSINNSTNINKQLFTNVKSPELSQQTSTDAKTPELDGNPPKTKIEIDPSLQTILSEKNDDSAYQEGQNKDEKNLNDSLDHRIEPKSNVQPLKKNLEKEVEINGKELKNEEKPDENNHEPEEEFKSQKEESSEPQLALSVSENNRQDESDNRDKVKVQSERTKLAIGLSPINIRVPSPENNSADFSVSEQNLKVLKNRFHIGKIVDEEIKNNISLKKDIGKPSPKGKDQFFHSNSMKLVQKSNDEEDDADFDLPEGIVAFDRPPKTSKKKISNLSSDLQKEDKDTKSKSNKEIESLISSLKTKDAQLNLLNSKIIKLEEEEKKIQTDMTEANRKLSEENKNLGQELEKMNAEIAYNANFKDLSAEFESKIEELALKNTSLQNRISELEPLAEKGAETISLKNKLSELEKKLSLSENTKVSLDEEIKKLKEINETKFSTQESTLKAQAEEIETLKSKLEKSEISKKEEISKLEQKLSKSIQASTQAEQRLADSLNKISKLESQIASDQDSLQKMREATLRRVSMTDESALILFENETLRKKLRVYESKDMEGIEEKNKSIDELKQKIKDLENQKVEISKRQAEELAANERLVRKQEQESYKRLENNHLNMVNKLTHVMDLVQTLPIHPEDRVKLERALI